MALTPADHDRVADAVRAAEARSAGEIAIVLAPASDAYHDVVLHWSLLAGLLPLALAATRPAWLDHLAGLFVGGWDVAPPPALSLTLLMGLTIAVFLIARLLFARPALRMALTPRATRTRRVRAQAWRMFRAGTEARTAAHNGVLLYVSLAEHRAEIVADSGIHGRVDPALWGEAMAAMIGRLREGDVAGGLVAAVERIGGVLADHFPRDPADPNELPDRVIEL